MERIEIRERRYENALLTRAHLFEAVDGDNVKFRVFLANVECGLKFGRIAPALQRLHTFPPPYFPTEDHDRSVRQVSR